MLTPRDVALRLCISISLVYQLCKEHQLKHFRFGASGKRGRIRIEESEVDRYVLENARVASPERLPELKHLKLQ